MKNFLLFFYCALLTITTMAAESYQVKTEEEFKQAVEKVIAGDQIIIANGTYNGWCLTVPTKASADKPIRIRAQSAGKVIFSGDVSKPIFLLTGSYTEISGLSFTDCNLFKTPNGNGVLIELKQSSYCRITDCRFTKNTLKSQYMPIVVVSGTGQHNRIDHCVFTGNIDNQEVQVKIASDAIPV
ncbi:hypothetical protein E0F88_27615 [Dyadobacter psychrotolerans]|uniref:Right handed beta helix domain-containing protein n=1 Tax=Dyadobacter psychrotolerans TaxID=2541721 RepID=A0A4R5DJS6_9BACT|nr:hypothetical protein E0F88_27615 [Dyadobacter psychrotolerans]